MLATGVVFERGGDVQRARDVGGRGNVAWHLRASNTYSQQMSAVRSRSASALERSVSPAVQRV